MPKHTHILMGVCQKDTGDSWQSLSTAKAGRIWAKKKKVYMYSIYYIDNKYPWWYTIND